MGVPHLMHASFSPPTHAAGLDPGSFVLLDKQAYFSDQVNATTTTSVDDQLIKVQVTFCLSKPPLLSYFCIHSPGLDPQKYGREPSILATEERFALLRVPICRRSCVSFQKYNSYFIYQASLRRLKPNPSSLRMLPNPHPLKFADNAIGILPRHTHKGVTFLLAALEPQFPIQNGVYKLHLFSGEVNNWTSRVLSCHLPRNSFLHTSKVITIDTKKGLMGWVDLWRGILICDVLSENPVLQYVQLPTPVVRNVPDLGDPNVVRDMVVVKGTVRYFAMVPKFIEGTRGLSATIWSTRRDHSSEWHEERTFDVFDVVLDENRRIELLTSPKGKDYTKPTISLFVASPALSLVDNHLVYFMAKIDFCDGNAWIISVYMNNLSLQGVSEFNAERTLALFFKYFGSSISMFFYLPSLKDREDPAERGGTDEIAEEQCKVPQNPMGTDSNGTSGKNKDVA